MKFIITALFACSVVLLMAQELPKDDNGKINFTDVVEMGDEFSASDLYTAAKEWFATDRQKFNRTNGEKGSAGMAFATGVKKANTTVVKQNWSNDEPLNLDVENEKLIGRVVLEYLGSNMGCVRLMFVEYDLKLYFKEGKYKYEATNFNYGHYNSNNLDKMGVGVMKDGGPCSSSGELDVLYNDCNKCGGKIEALYAYLTTDVNDLLADLKKFISENQSAGSDW